MFQPLSRCLFLAALLIVPACNTGGDDGGTTIELKADSLDGTTWTLQSVEGATVPVSGSLTFRKDGSYEFIFKAPPIFDERGTGTFKLQGRNLTVTGILARLLANGGLLELLAKPGQLSFRDNDGDLWVYSGNYNSSGGSSGNCIAVQTGPWEFELSKNGLVILHFVDGDLSQSGCFLSYDDDQVFTGNLSNATWTVSSKAGFDFTGTFTGQAPTRFFRGTFTANGQNGVIDGNYVGN